MTTAADSADEKAFEAVLAGRFVPAGAADRASGIAVFTEAVRATATQPGRPNAALAELLANGLIVDQPSPSPRTAKRRRRRMWFFTAIIAKIASAGAVAQAATGAGIVLVGFTTAGAAGVLPGPVQDTFTHVVSNVTGTDPATATATTTPADISGTPSTSPAAITPAGVPAAVPTTAGPSWKPEKTEGDDDAKNYGQAVSSAAHERNDERKDERTASSTARATSSATADSEDRDARGSSTSGKSQHGDD